MSDRLPRDIFWETVGDDGPVPVEPATPLCANLMDRVGLLALILLILGTFWFAWTHCHEDKRNTCEVQAWVTKQGLNERVLVCRADLQFDRIYTTPDRMQ